jgi:hypothetical protein
MHARLSYHQTMSFAKADNTTGIGVKSLQLQRQPLRTG